MTFEESPVVSREIADRIGKVLSASLPWIVLEHAEQVAGYAYASQWHGRSAYRFSLSLESTVYLARAATGQGFGTRLYERLISILVEGQAHVVIGGIALPNAASVALHEKFGFEKVGHFKEVGFKFGQWIDVGYWQRPL